jgi:hypothetical protein
MKTCLCCGVKADAAARTCANCGEGSWSAPIVESKPVATMQFSEFSELKIEPSDKPIATDPETKVEGPVRTRRSKKPN